MRSRKRQPNYLIASDLILEMIHRDQYQVGEAIPSISKLTIKFGMSRISVQQAVKLLAKKEILETVPGSGCYLKQMPSRQPLRLRGPDRFSSEYNDSWALPGTNASPKKIRIGIFSELPRYAGQWKTLFESYTSRCPDVQIELIPVDNQAFYLNEANSATVDICQIPAFLLPWFVKRRYLFDLQELGGLELPEDDFYPGLIESAVFRGKIYGVPLISATVCQFYNKKYADSLDDCFAAHGFWDYMNRLKRLVETRQFSGCESIVANADSLFVFFLLSKLDKCNSYDEIKTFSSCDYYSFMKRFESFFRDSRIFHPDVEIHSLTAINTFTAGKTPILMGNSCWMPRLQDTCPFEFGIVPQFAEVEGFSALATNLNVLSAFTPYPEECLAVLRYLKDCTAQKYLAEKGRIVANQRANDSLRIAGLDKQSHAHIRAALKKGKVIRTADIHIDDYINKIVNIETQKWQSSLFSAEELIDVLRRKTSYFYRARSKTKSAAGNPGYVA